MSISIPAPNKATVKSDNSNSTTINALVVDSSSAAVPNATVTFSAPSGLLSQSVIVSDSSGKASVTFSAGSTQSNSTVTLTATCNGATAQIPITITGSTVAVALASGAALPSDGSATTTMTVTALDAGANPVPNTPVTFTQTGGGAISITPATGVTDANGHFTATVAGTTAGSVTITAHAVGATATQAINVFQGASTSSFGIDLVNNAAPPADHIAALALNTAMPIEVNVPTGVTQVQFVTTIGTWVSTGTSQALVNVVAGKATASLTSAIAGVATVQVYNPSNAVAQSDTLSVAITAAVANKITLQATPTVIARNTGGQGGVSTIVATVRDANNAPVGNAPVAFSIVNPTGGGEYITKTVVFTAATNANNAQLGQASTTLVAGSLSSPQVGVQVQASVVGTAVTTALPAVPPSGSDASIVIGGTAGSVAIGRASVIQSDNTNTYYVLPMTVLVADSNNNPVSGATVSLSAWPIAFNTGGACLDDANDAVNTKGWFYSEDANENLTLDAGEDGARQLYPNGAIVPGGTADGKLTPVNSDGGTVPSTVTTNANGAATFNLTYTKASAIHIWSRIRASTIVQGTETVGQTDFILPGLTTDLTPTCLLPPSSWHF